jgi:YidC/Oxa1 family membrane protein insertase
MEKRLLVAIFLSFLVLYAYQVFVLKPASEKAKRQAPAAATTLGATPGASPSGGASPAPGGGAAGGSAQAAAAVVAAAPAAALVTDPEERDIVVETRTVTAVFTNRGARLKSWKLKSYLDLSKKPQELVATDLPPYRARPFELKVDDAAATETLRAALFQASAGSAGAVVVGARPQTLTFEYKDVAGLSARKEFTFEPDGYVVRVNATVETGGRSLNPTVLWGLGLGDQKPGAAASSYVQKAEGIIVRGDKVQRLGAADLDRQPVQEGIVTAAGVDTHYFIVLAMPARMLRTEYWRGIIPAPAGMDPKKSADLVGFGVRQAQSMSDVKFFVGPKDFDVLQAADPRLVRTINFGIFDFLAVPLLRALKWIHGYVANYGWAIIILTFLINAVMFPLRHKSMVSMRKMQEIQPQVKAIQDRYAGLKATDPAKQKMNSEMMSLYKEKGVNPASGCIPMLLTMPVLFAFYSLLSQAIEIRGEPFIWWIKDLSAQDPYYVTPILMGASQFWQQRLTPPAGGDPVQQKMMMMMPLVFTFMFLWMPSGLTVYWFFSNMLAIGQQYLTNHLVGPPNAPRPAAERKTKTVLSGR